MNKYLKLKIFIILVVGILMFSKLENIFAQTSNIDDLNAQLNTTNQNLEDLNKRRAELEAKIKEKTAELEKINKELQNTQSNLSNTRQQKISLQNEIKRLNETIKQLELNISADETTIQKLKLEIESLSYDIKDISLSIEKKKEAIIKILQEIQRKQDKNLLIILLSNNNLADIFTEGQNLLNLKNQLRLDIVKLNDLQKELNEKLNTTQNKKEEVETRKNNLAIKQMIMKDQKEEKNIILAQTKNKESLYAKQLEELQKQQDSLEEEIYKMEEELRKSFNFGLLPPKQKGLLSWPIKLKEDGGIGIISQRYGKTPYSNRLYRGKPHNGLDIGVPVGTPVYSADDGIVMAVDNNDKSSWAKYQYGKYVLIKHNNGLATLYAHLSQWVVSKGQTVSRGQLIGYSGNTGYSTGPHLHFGVYWASSIILKAIPPAGGLVPVGVTINPEDYL
jgi:murein DD-endopeptidase MepM/ murein hydrolase activator NlpD